MNRQVLFCVALSSLLAACTGETGVDEPDPDPAVDPAIELLAGEAAHEESGLIWRRCPVGMDWDGAGCAGMAVELDHEEAIAVCESLHPDYRLPTLGEYSLLLGGCGMMGVAQCPPCAASDACSATLGGAEAARWAWTADDADDGESAFVVEPRGGRVAFERRNGRVVNAFCVRAL